MDTAQWPQDIGMEKTLMEDQSMGSDNQKRARPQEQLNCPRCNSTNTKFCYYNNYSLTQPRYFCKTCRRYWTEGGTLRNVPVGGGSRKNKKPTSSTASSSANSSPKNLIPDLNPPSCISHFSSQNPRMSSGHEGGQDLNLAFSGNMDHYPKMEISNMNSSSSPSSALELLRSTGIANSRGVNSNSYIPINAMQDSDGVIYSSSPNGFSLQEFKPSPLGFSVDGLGISRYGDHQENNNGPAGRMLFPFGDLKQINSSAVNAAGHHDFLDQNKGQGNPTGYWNGLMGGGSW